MMVLRRRGPYQARDGLTFDERRQAWPIGTAVGERGRRRGRGSRAWRHHHRRGRWRPRSELAT